MLLSGCLSGRDEATEALFVLEDLFFCATSGLVEIVNAVRRERIVVAKK